MCAHAEHRECYGNYSNSIIYRGLNISTNIYVCEVNFDFMNARLLLNTKIKMFTRFDTCKWRTDGLICILIPHECASPFFFNIIYKRCCERSCTFCEEKGMFDEAMQTQLHYLNHACAPSDPWRSIRSNDKVAGGGVVGGIYFLCIYWILKIELKRT